MLIKKVDASFYMSVGMLRRGDPFFKNGRKNEKKPEKMRRERFWDLNPSKIFQNRLG